MDDNRRGGNGVMGWGAHTLIMAALNTPENEVQGVCRSKVADSRVCHCRGLLSTDNVVILAPRDSVAGELVICHHALKQPSRDGSTKELSSHRSQQHDEVWQMHGLPNVGAAEACFADARLSSISERQTV